jgi:transaldolase
MASLLEQLKKYTVVVADTGDLNSIAQFKPRDATTNPSLITAAAQMDEYRDIVDGTLKKVYEAAGANANVKDVIAAAIDRLAVDFGLQILKVVPGRVSTEVDARLSYDEEGTYDKALQLIKMYNDAGISNDRVLIKIAATWEGIRACERLEREGIFCNLTLMFGLHQAIACAEAGATLISPFVGRILDWYKADTGTDHYEPQDDPGVVSVTQIFNHYKKFGYKTEIMGASFRNMGELTELAGCDLLTISPKLLTVLKETEGELTLKLDPEKAKAMDLEKLHIDKETFDRMHVENRMATDKLAQGIEGFSKAIVALENMLTERLLAIIDTRKKGQAAGDLFKVYDLDGDGFITHEEWGGTDAVFSALDTNSDGRITPDEMAAGLGAAHLLED